VVNDAQNPLAARVGMHLSSLLALLNVYDSTASPARSIQLQEIPSLSEFTESGLGPFLK
jgi:hypothetical protein